MDPSSLLLLSNIHNTYRGHSLQYRWPLLFLLCATSIIVKLFIRTILLTTHWRSTSSFTLILSFLAIIALILTAVDFYLVLTHAFKTFQKTLHSISSNLVLDKVLHSTFSHEGALGSVVSGILGSIVVYNAGLKEEQRVRLVRSCFALSPSNGYGMKEVMLEPGGFVPILPLFVRRVLLGESARLLDKDCDQDDMLQNQLENHMIHEEHKTLESTIEENDRDMIWEDDDNGGSTGNGVESTDNSISDEEDDDDEHRQKQHRIFHKSRVSIFGQSRTPCCKEKVPCQPLEDPIRVIQDIAYDKVRSMLQITIVPPIDSIIQKCNVRRIGSVASLALILQLKYSRTARNVVKGVLHGSVTLGLGSAVLGSSLFGLLSLWDMLSSSSSSLGKTKSQTTGKEGINDDFEMETSNLTFTNHTSLLFRGLVLINVHERFLCLWLMMKKVMAGLTKDERTRKKVQRLIALIVFACIGRQLRKQRYRQSILQLSR